MGETGIVRPTGVTILAVLEFLGGILGILGGLVLLGAEEAFGEGIFAVFSIWAFIAGFIALAVGYGLWNLLKWGYQAAMILAILGIISGLFSLPSGILSIVIDGIIIYYLIQPEIKDVFGITAFLT